MNTRLIPDNMSGAKREIPPVLEWLVLAIVVFASSTLSIEPIVEEENNFETDIINGTIILSTRSSLAALGLGDEIETGAVATIEIKINSIISEGCIDCENKPVGIQMNGDVEIENIRGAVGGLGRVEGTISVTYLREYVNENFIKKEWLNIDWNASGGTELDTYWEFVIHHDPPKWVLNDRYNAAFISIDENKESRTGSWLLAETLVNGTQNIQGCLPDSLPCEKSSNPDIFLTSTQKPISTPIVIAHPLNLEKMTGFESTNETPNEMKSLRQLMNTENEIEEHHIWCPESNENMIAIKSWDLNNSGNNLISPMGLWFDILNLPSSSFNLINGIWTEIEFDDFSCASITDKNNVFKIGIITK